MKVITQRQMIQGVADRWFKKYAPFKRDEIEPWRGNKTKSGTWKELDALNKDEATPEQVNDIIGNESWTRMTCDECGANVDRIIRLGQEPDYESSTADICRSCLEKAYDLANPDPKPHSQTSKPPASDSWTA